MTRRHLPYCWRLWRTRTRARLSRPVPHTKHLLPLSSRPQPSALPLLPRPFGNGAALSARKLACRACLMRAPCQFGLFGGGGGGVFESSFRAYPVSFIDKARS